MLSLICELLAKRHITVTAPLALKDCRVTKPYLLERAGITDGTAVLFAVPYYTTECDNIARNISSYAVSADYHAFFGALFEEILPELRAAFPTYKFAGFSDYSPIDEKHAALASGLGVIGKNHLLLTKEHSSYIFLGEIVTDAIFDITPHPFASCPDCGACLAACPVGLDGEKCLSALTQKKGKLTEEEERAILANGSAWGCDRCQEVCPMTAAARAAGTLFSPIPYFKETALPHLTYRETAQMEDGEFQSRAYSWRGRETILRNLKLFEEDDRS